MSLSHLLFQAREVARAQAAPTDGVYRLFFAVSDMQRRALVRHACGPDFDAAWKAGASAIERAAAKACVTPHALRVDWATELEKSTGEALAELLSKTKRNYFRRGLALDAGFATAFTEQELNANAMLYGGNTVEHAVLNIKNCVRYCRVRFDRDFEPPAAHEPVWLFATQGVFCGEDGVAVPLTGTGRNAGLRDFPLTAENVRGLVDSASAYLARQVDRQGRFAYGVFPCFNRDIPTYNTLRHVGSVYAMLDAWALTRDATLLAAARRALDYARDRLFEVRTLPDGGEAGFFVDRDSGEIRLGAGGVALLCFGLHQELTGDDRYAAVARLAARGVLHMQNPADGSFTHVLHARDLSVKESFRIVYYDGEAVFGLLRLYRANRDETLLRAAEKAFERFIAAERWKYHDHWLAYASREMIRWRPEARYFAFALDNVLERVPFVRRRLTAYPTLLELMLASEDVVRRLAGRPDLADLAARVDEKAFREALEYRAAYLVNGFFWPELAMFYQNPARVAGSFFIRHQAFRVRIDDVQHYLSGFVAYARRPAAKSDGAARPGRPLPSSETPEALVPHD